MATTPVTTISKTGTVAPTTTKTHLSNTALNGHLDPDPFVVLAPTTALGPTTNTATTSITSTVNAGVVTPPPPPPPPIFIHPTEGQSTINIEEIVDEVQLLQRVVASQHGFESGPSLIGSTILFGHSEGFQVLDNTTGQTTLASGLAYSGPLGPVAGHPDAVSQIDKAYVNITPDNLNIKALTSKVFIHSGAGDDVLTAGGGSTIMNAGGGSNTLVTNASAAKDIMIVDADATKSITDVFPDFKVGDDIVVRGLTPNGFTYAFDGSDKQLSITATQNANPAIKTTLLLDGHNTFDVSSGKLQIAFSSDGAGSDFMMVHGALN